MTLQNEMEVGLGGKNMRICKAEVFSIFVIGLFIGAGFTPMVTDQLENKIDLTRIFSFLTNENTLIDTSSQDKNVGSLNMMAGPDTHWDFDMRRDSEYGTLDNGNNGTKPDTTLADLDLSTIEKEYAEEFVVMDVIPPVDYTNLSPKPVISETPSEFSWKMYDGYDWTTPAKNQGSCGSCWAFAAISALESIIKIRENCPILNPDLSEQYILSCLSAAGDCRGGSSIRAFQYMLQDTHLGNYKNGALFEEKFPYGAVDAEGCNYYNCDNDPILCSEKSSDWEEYMVPLSDYSYWDTDGSKEDIERIKTQIMETGPVVTSMYATDNFKEWVATHHGID